MKQVIVTTALALSLGLSGCATSVPIPSSTIVPAASGFTKVSKDDNGNTKIEFKVQNLAPPQNLQPTRSIYVVWVQTSDNKSYNLGQLKVDKNLKGTLNAITPFTSFRLVVSAEDFPTVSLPSQQVILSTELLEAK